MSEGLAVLILWSCQFKKFKYKWFKIPKRLVAAFTLGSCQLKKMGPTEEISWSGTERKNLKTSILTQLIWVEKHFWKLSTTTDQPTHLYWCLKYFCSSNDKYLAKHVSVKGVWHWEHVRHSGCMRAELEKLWNKKMKIWSVPIIWKMSWVNCIRNNYQAKRLFGKKYQGWQERTHIVVKF